MNYNCIFCEKENNLCMFQRRYMEDIIWICYSCYRTYLRLSIINRQDELQRVNEIKYEVDELILANNLEDENRVGGGEN